MNKPICFIGVLERIILILCQLSIHNLSYAYSCRFQLCSNTTMRGLLFKYSLTLLTAHPSFTIFLIQTCHKYHLALN